ncbi:MAG: flagellar biosynthesis anti-sigma factor FlgM [Planctomycetota bacterium]|nr:MAG: flagellar biosynthesis anti-sigma factor FlgM [Planctomycetota bacterium]
MSLEGIHKASQIQPLGSIQNQESLQNITSPNKIHISEEAKILDNLSEIPDIRQEKVENIRAQILAGTYLDDQNLEKAMESLLQDLL